MAGVLTGFGIIGAVILVGYVIGRSGLLGDSAQFVLSRIVFFVLSPALLFTVLAKADVHELFSRLLVVSALSAVAAILLFFALARLVWRRRVADATVGAAASGYVNANNIGLPVAVYVLGNPAFSAPVILFQLLVLAPIILTTLDIATSGAASVRRILLQPVRNPLIIASALGVIVAVTGVTIPAPVMEPFTLVGGAAVPIVLMSFGMSLHGQRVFEPGSARIDVVVATALKLVVMPLVAWVLGALVFGLTGLSLFAVVTLAALPTAQNVFNYAQRYDAGTTLARDTVLITTVGSIPVLVVVSLLLNH
ncbi:AEC family transporter [Galbitalea soli]|uniref:AEC family transporter n=1 Tax=Galbitalea soli TaxID=1268042 RepID=A0A7C9TSH2_9MICO|nr:AEC family transporter [Galbitalea soli]NYJ29280.1 hypothetical protein [Galbitalea soli]